MTRLPVCLWYNLVYDTTYGPNYLVYELGMPERGMSVVCPRGYALGMPKWYELATHYQAGYELGMPKRSTIFTGSMPWLYHDQYGFSYKFLLILIYSDQLQ